MSGSNVEALDRAADAFLEGEQVPDDEAPPDSEAARARQVWAAVIQQAILDARGVGAWDMGKQDEQAARRFLLSDLDPWRRDRETVADLAGVDPDALRQHAERLLRPMIEAELAKPQAPLPVRKRRMLAPADHKSQRTYAGRPLLTPEQKREHRIAAKRACRMRRSQRLRQATALAAGRGGDVGRGNAPDKADASLRASPALYRAA